METESAAAQGDPGAGLPGKSAISVTPLTDAVAKENGQRIRAAIEKLDPAQRQAVEMAFFDDLSHSQIAEKLGKPLGTVKTNIRQGLIRLREFVRMD
jgi:RNA polymerase sigma-70 factor (ECF subfamily)